MKQVDQSRGADWEEAGGEVQARQEALEELRGLASRTPGVLAEVMANDSAPPAARLKAVEMILDRTYGKAEMAAKASQGDVLQEIRAAVEKFKGGGADD